MISLAACGAEQGKLEVRAIPRPIAPGSKPASFRLAEAHGQMALGNVALALESYRKAVREDPNSAEAQAGMAVAYDKMGRFDLSRRYYEAALAIEPANTGLLTTLAASLDMQGKRAEAANVRAEIALRSGAARAKLADEPVRIDAAPVAVAANTPMQLPAVALQPEPDAVAPQKEAKLVPYVSPSRKPAPEPVKIESAPVALASSITAKLPSASFEQEPEAPAAAMAAVIPTEKPVATAAVGRSVTVTLPPPRPVAAKSVAAPTAPPTVEIPPAAVAAVPAPQPAVPAGIETPAPVAVAAVALPPKQGARLERLSMTEVALVTNDQPKWRPQLVAQTARMATVKFVPLRQSGVRNASVILLNAARHRGLAARTRGYLSDRGWRSLAIGDASRTRSTSLVLYPASRRSLGLRVAAQFGFAAAPHTSAKEVMVLLGRDATSLPPLRTRG